MPVAYGLLDKDFVKDLKEDGTYSELTFAREYNSIWGGAREESFFSSERFDQSRVLDEALWDGSSLKRNEKIILSYDVGRTMDQSSCMVIRITPSPNGGSPMKDLVNLYNFEKMDFSVQAANIKKLYFQFNAEKIVIDGNGLGIGLIDFMTMPTTDIETGEVYPPFGVDPETDPKNLYRGKHRFSNGIDEVLHIVKATSSENSSMSTYLATQIESGKVRFLIDDQVKQEKLKRGMHWKSWSEIQRITELQPFKLTRLLKEEMMNLKKEGNSTNIRLVQMASGVKKDMFSSLQYGLWYARKLEVQKRTSDDELKKMMLNTSSSNSYSGSGRGHNVSIGARRSSSIASRRGSKGGRRR